MNYTAESLIKVVGSASAAVSTCDDMIDAIKERFVFLSCLNADKIDQYKQDLTAWFILRSELLIKMY